MSLSKLAKLILPLDESLAREVLNELVEAANRSEVDTDQGRTGFESDVFKAFAAKDNAQSLIVAQTFKDRLRRIVSLATVYKWTAEGLTQKGRVSK
jgi:nucleotide-binding universal stress UspA family protein